MLLSLIDLYLALEFKGFAHWDPKTKAVFCIIVGVFTIVATIAFIRKVGVIAILIPCVIVGAMYMMNQNSGCMNTAADVQEEGSYDKKKKAFTHSDTKPTTPTPAPAPSK